MRPKLTSLIPIPLSLNSFEEEKCLEPKDLRLESACFVFGRLNEAKRADNRVQCSVTVEIDCYKCEKQLKRNFRNEKPSAIDDGGQKNVAKKLNQF